MNNFLSSLDKAQAYFERGNQALACQDWQTAFLCFRESIKAKPEFAEAYHNWGFALMKSGELKEAEALFLKTLEFNPCSLNAYYNLAFVYEKMKLWGDAEACLRLALKINPYAASTYNSLGVALEHAYNLAEAEKCYLRAIELDPSDAYAYYNLGNLCKVMRRFQDAEEYLVKACTLSPDDKFEMILAFFYLTIGQFAEGWKLYGKVQRKRQEVCPSFNVRPWFGESLVGSKVLVYMGDGLGDSIHFVRYVKQMACLAAEITLFVQEPLERLLAASYPDVKVSASERVLRDNYDFACSLQSMPIIFSTTEQTIPYASSYLYALPKDIEYWRKLLIELDGGEKIRIGIVWAGNPDNTMDYFRSIPFAVFSKLFAIKEASWFSLQVGKHAQDCKDNAAVFDLAPKLTDFAQTAGAIHNLDLVITMDTSVAHLAGAMGKQTWLLLDVNSDWRWLMDREDSPWYSSMRLFRQRRAGDWADVIERVLTSLDNLLQRHNTRFRDK